MAEIHVPQLGEGLREVRIVELLRRTGDAIRRGDPLYVIETDKTTIEMEAPIDGRLMRWRVAPDDIVPIGATVADIGAEKTERRTESRREPASRVLPPRTRAYARSKGLSEDTIEKIPAATGKLLPSDIDAYLATVSIAPPHKAGYREFKVVGAHRTLIYRLRRSASTVIPGTITVEIPWSVLKIAWAKDDGLRPTPVQVFGHALSQVARERPMFRSVMIGDDTIREYDRVNIGLALARPENELITAVVRGAEKLTLQEFARACTRQMRAALRQGDQAADDTQILVSHIGEIGVVDAVPTLVAPATSVYFLGAPRPENGMARAWMTFDHRLINGATAGAFLEAVTKYLRNQLRA
jgi:pyruvate/2-oxoglutarate dehydrogenase complex dihydrolipoamide acyltransferase (E2) component